MKLSFFKGTTYNSKRPVGTPIGGRLDYFTAEVCIILLNVIVNDIGVHKCYCACARQREGIVVSR